MSDKLTNYQRGATAIPTTQGAWHVYGAGLENVGQEGQPVEIPVGRPGPDQLLARIDAAGICFSDIKIIKQGGDHPRLYGRDLRHDPIVPGHEVALTVVEVGEQLRYQYHVGDRFVVQADVYVNGKNLAFGYMLPGAFEQYVILGDEVLRGDEGSYLIPMQAETGYAEAALAEPWACVVCAHRTDFRRNFAPGGTLLIIGGAGKEGYTLGALAAGPGPQKIVLTDVPADLTAEITAAAAAWGAEIVVSEPLHEGLLETLKQQQAPEGFDDVVLLGAHCPELIEAAAAVLGREGVLALVGAAPSRPLNLDLGRIHYDYTRYYGAPGRDLAAAYAETRAPGLTPGGKAWIMGGAGPMGQMHVQIAAQGSEGPSVIVVSDLDDERLELVRERMEPVARARGREIVLLNPKALGQEAFEARLREIAPEGFDDIHVLVPVPTLIADAVRFAGRRGLVEIFAGIPRGSFAATDLGPVVERQVRFQGTSGSLIADLRTTLHMTESGEIDTNASVAGIGGLEAVHAGLEAVLGMAFPGKIVIYPQISGLPLTAITDLAEQMPEVAALLGPGGLWTREAEKALLKRYL
ncbi:MAG TPA: alcohol dehydrogenase catalytic domain-containing protein [Armatimonadota bacterium]|jgi:threonine dehydrogenase-like Zn-dependent dehydrogenase